MFSFSFDPTIRHSFWSLLVGGTIFWINTNGCNQSMVQRFLSLKDVRTARKGLIIYVIGISIMMALCMYNGLLIFAKYHDCDPLESGLVKAKDQLLPLLVVDLLRELPGVPGLFIAGVFSAALSSLSTGLNSMSAVILEDFFKSFSKRTITERETAIIMRASVFILGSIAVGLVYVVQHMGSVLQLSMTVPAACLGPMLGVFFIGMFMPFIDAKVPYGSEFEPFID
jgi:sodium-coupled monocarboxylate transporter 8/12